MSQSLSNIVVDVLGECIKLEDLDIDQIPKKLFQWELGGLLDPIGQLIGWLWDQTQAALNYLSQTLLGSFRTIRDYIIQVISGILSGISSGISSISSLFSGLASSLSSVTSYLSSVISTITSSITSLSSTLAGFGNWLQSIYGTLTSLASTIISSISGVVGQIQGWITTAIGTINTTVSQMASVITGISSAIGGLFNQIAGAISGVAQTIMSSVSGALSSIGSTISSAFSSVTSYLGSIGNVLATIATGVSQILVSLGSQIWEGLLGLKTWFADIAKNIVVGVSQLGTQMATFFATIPQRFSDLWAWLEGGWNKFKQDIGLWWTDAQKWWDEKVKNTNQAITEVQLTLGGFVNPLIEIKNVLAKALTGLGDFFKDPKKAISDAIMGFVEWGKIEVVPKIMSVLSGAYEWIASGLSTIWKGITSVATKIWDFITKGIATVVDGITKTMSGVTAWFKKILGEFFFTPFAKLPSIMLGDFLKKGGAGVPTPEEMLMNLGSYMFGAFSAPYVISSFMMYVGDNTKATFSLEPFGIGGRLPVKWGSIIKHLAKIVWKIPDILLGSIAYGFGIWISQPITRLINSGWRNAMPVEMPSLQEIRIIANRASVTTAFGDVMKTLKLFMGYYGFSDWSIDYNLADETALSTQIKDRFGKPVTIPISLRHALPTGSELSRMMIRDVIIEFEDFAKVMKIAGYHKDLARLYYLLHYRYPTPENLWNFYRRGMAGMLWYAPVHAAYPEKAMGIGVDPVAPATLNMKEPVFKDMIERYMKWHDYAPFAWGQGWTSDRYTIIDLMAEIPQRIDARWMYRFSVIPDGKTDGSVMKSVFNIVRARGVHPDWEEDIAVAECLNAMSEERNYVRTGLMNAFERGFTTEAITDKTLSQITTVSILGKDRPIKFLDGEKKLLLIRHNYDRGLNVLRGLWQHTTLAIQRHMIDRPTVIELFKGFAGKLRTILGLDFQIDEPFLDSWLEIFEIRRDFESVQRIRYWMRIFIYRATQLAESGEAFERIVDEYAAKALLTSGEVEIMKSLGRAFIEAYKRNRTLSMIKNIIKGKIKRGDMTIEGGIAELIKAGMSKGEAEAYLESEVKPRVVSIDKLISMREYIPIDPMMLKKKMDAEGVPPDEQALYIPYSVATEVSEEMGKISTEIINDYVAGAIDETTMRQNLSALATLNGTVQQRLGVEWIVLSPEEREMLVTMAKIRRARGIGVTEEGVPIPKWMTADKLTTLMEYVPVSAQKFKETMDREGIPLDEQKMRVAYGVATELSEEVGRLATELVTDYANAMISELQLKKELDNLATLGGAVPKFLEVPWIVLSPQERSMFIALAKLRKARMKK